MRKGEKRRVTKETAITVSMNLDGTGENAINTGIGFFDHMLELFSYHSRIDLKVECKGDTNVDFHHSVEDVGLAMGDLINSLLGDRKGIERYASFFAPMDEALAFAAIDISGRPIYCTDFSPTGKCGDFDCELVNEFFRAFVTRAGICLHVKAIAVSNMHHIIEAVFKAVAHALKIAVAVTGTDIPSTKGVI